LYVAASLLSDWLFDLDQAGDVARLPAAALTLARDPAAARAKAAQVRAFVQQRQREMVATLRRVSQVG